MMRMPFLNFGIWTASHGRWFSRERIWIDGWIWTPFIWMKLRKVPSNSTNEVALPRCEEQNPCGVGPHWVECWNCGGGGVVAGCLEDTCSCGGNPDDLQRCCAPYECSVCKGNGGWEETATVGSPAEDQFYLRQLMDCVPE